MKCPICKENFVIRFALEDHLLEHFNTKDRKHPEFVQAVAGLPQPKFCPTVPSEALAGTTTVGLVEELFSRGERLLAMGEDLRDTHDAILKAFSQFDSHSVKSKEACKHLADEAIVTVKQSLATAQQQLLTVADTLHKDCATITKTTEEKCLTRAEALEEECLRRVKEAEDQCRKTVEAVTLECNKRGEAAEAEALKCMELADQATAAANSLGQSYNVLNERLHNLEISIRTLFAGGMAPAPVYTPQAAPPPPPVLFVAPVTAPAPAPKPPAPSPAPVKHSNNGSAKMEVVLLGLHQKNAQHIVQALRKPTARGVRIVIVEDTSNEVLPKSADYAIVSGHSALALRWKWCLDNYGPAKCVRLENGSLAAFRDKIEQLYESRHPMSFQASNAPINSIAAPLIEAARNAI